MTEVISYANRLILLVTISTLLGVGLAKTRPIDAGRPGDNNTTIVNVGGSNNTWTFGFNYGAWAYRNAPFYVNDTLVFKYARPTNNTFPHSVYLFSDYSSYRSCNLKNAKMIGSVTQGGGHGFRFVLQNWRPYFFSCGEHAPIHCKIGKMKFMVMPQPHRSQRRPVINYD